MKSRKRKILSVMLALIVLAGCLTPSVEVKAGISLIPYQKSMTISKGSEAFINMFRIDGGSTGLWTDRKISIKNKKIVSHDKEGDQVQGFVIRGLKKGSTTLTIRYKLKNGKQKKYYMKVKVVPYENPVKSLKIGSQSLTSLFKKAKYNVSYTHKASSEKISVKPASGWKVKSITYDGKKIKNNQKITYDDYDDYYDGMIIGNIEIILYKSKTKQTETLNLNVR